jgi:DNA/RNA-binding domain of Phe-tRNA-synthetase-like protein
VIYRVDPKIFEAFPHFYRGVVFATGVDNSSLSQPVLAALLSKRIKDVEADDSISLDHPRIRAWYDVYRSFQSKSSRKLQPSIASLVRRIKNGGGSTIRFISPLVCLSNIISLSHLVPSGLIDADRSTGDLMLGYAQGSENFVPIGARDPSPPEPDEIIYYDRGSRNVMCRAWNSRAGQATLVLPSTRRIVLDIDGLLTVIPKDEVDAATDQAASLMREYCAGRTEIAFLSRANPTFHARFTERE